MSENKVVPYLKYLFIGVALAELSAHVFGWSFMNEFTKPLLMPILLVYFRRSFIGPITLPVILAVFALVFSWFGDVALMFVSDQEVYFLVGLGAFAVAQLLYVFSFKQACIGEASKASVFQHLLKIFPFAVFVVGLLWMLWPELGEFRLPVVGYAVLIASMAISAVYRGGRTNTESFNQVVMGAILFVLSDTLLAIDKFYAPMENARIWVMSTYILAQWNIINGLLKHYKN
jgi:uncharacterized membrane protein YhhN